MPFQTMRRLLKLVRESLSATRLSDLAWTAAGNVASVMLGLAVVAIISAKVDSAEYGKASLVLGAVGLIGSFVSGPVLAVHQRLYFDYLKKNLAYAYLQAFALVLLSVAALGAFVFAAIAIGYAEIGNTKYYTALVPACLLILAQTFNGATLGVIEAHRKYKLLAYAGVGQRLGYLLMILALLMFGGVTAIQILIAHIVSLVFVLLIGGSSAYSQIRDSKSAKGTVSAIALFRSSRSLGLVVTYGYVASWVLTTSDRYLIEHYLSDAAVGIYTMNYGLWTVPYMFVNGWLEIVTRARLYGRAADQDWNGVRAIVRLRLISGVAICLFGTALLWIFGDQIGELFLGSKYWAGSRVMMFIASGQVCMVVAYTFVAQCLAEKRAAIIAASTASGAIVGIVANLLLIPAHGILGSAVASFFANLTWAAILAWYEVRGDRRASRSVGR